MSSSSSPGDQFIRPGIITPNALGTYRPHPLVACTLGYTAILNIQQPHRLDIARILLQGKDTRPKNALADELDELDDMVIVDGANPISPETLQPPPSSTHPVDQYVDPIPPNLPQSSSACTVYPETSPLEQIKPYTRNDTRVAVDERALDSLLALSRLKRRRDSNTNSIPPHTIQRHQISITMPPCGSNPPASTTIARSPEICSEMIPALNKPSNHASASNIVLKKAPPTQPLVQAVDTKSGPHIRDVNGQSLRRALAPALGMQYPSVLPPRLHIDAPDTIPSVDEPRDALLAPPENSPSRNLKSYHKALHDKIPGSSVDQRSNRVQRGPAPLEWADPMEIDDDTIGTIPSESSTGNDITHPANLNVGHWNATFVDLPAAIQNASAGDVQNAIGTIPNEVYSSTGGVDGTESDEQLQLPPLPTLRHGGDVYTVIHILDKGIDGRCVFCADHPKFGQVAIKVFDKKYYPDRISEYRDILSLEQQIMKVVATEGYSYLVPLLASWEDENNLYLVMRMYNESLEQLLSRGTYLPPDLIKLYAAELVLALVQLVHLDVLHRDIKPDNIFISPSGHIVLADYGSALARVGIQDCCIISTVAGTMGYVAPEAYDTHYMKRPGYGFKADIWSLGAVIFQMAFGLKLSPFSAENDIEARAVIFDSTWLSQIQSHQDPLIRDLLKKMLKPDPRERLSLAELQTHPFFDGVDWVKLKNREYNPVPYRPEPLQLKLSDFTKFQKYLCPTTPVSDDLFFYYRCPEDRERDIRHEDPFWNISKPRSEEAHWHDQLISRLSTDPLPLYCAVVFMTVFMQLKLIQSLLF